MALMLWDSEAERLARLLRSMHYDDALVCGQMRVEYLYLARGYPQWRVMWRGQILGAVYVRGGRSAKDRARLACWLAAACGGAGWRLVRGGARTCLQARRARQLVC